MLNIPAALFTKYSILLNKKSVPASVHSNYKKWLWYYLDLCHKYHHRYADKKSLKHFRVKLHGKHQSPAMQEDAAQVVSIYIEKEKEEKMFPLPENVIRLLTMNLGV